MYCVLPSPLDCSQKFFIEQKIALKKGDATGEYSPTDANRLLDKCIEEASNYVRT